MTEHCDKASGILSEKLLLTFYVYFSSILHSLQLSLVYFLCIFLFTFSYFALSCNNSVCCENNNNFVCCVIKELSARSLTSLTSVCVFIPYHTTSTVLSLFSMYILVHF